MGFATEEMAAMAEAEVIGAVPLADIDFSVTGIGELNRIGAMAELIPDYRKAAGLDGPTLW